MKESDKALIHYENPPVVEVVCGVLFDPIKPLLAPHLGLLWEKYRAEYPDAREVPPLATMMEHFDGTPEVRFEIGDIPPLPRVWFLHSSENGIIQVQRDRFLHNWRKIRPEDAYPRYPHVREMFEDRLSTFESFLLEEKLGTMEPLQYEMTYVNHIPQGEAWPSLGALGRLFPDFAFRNGDGRFLPNPAAMDWRTSFDLPDRAGRLHVTIRRGNIRDTGIPILLLDLTARGIGPDKSRDGFRSWFDLAHEWIVYGFADLTGEEVQKTVWRRLD